MPELPEVETVRKQLDEALTGQKIVEISKLHPKSLQGSSLKVIGKKVVGVKRRAKMIWIDLEGDLNLLVHLKMTGQLLFERNFQFSKPNFQNKYTRVIITLTNGRLIFNDLRIFGWIKTVSNNELKQYFSNLPPDVVDREFTPKYLERMLKKSNRAVKLVLLDQQKMGGIGNIYANEALFCAGINPSRPVNIIIGLKVRFLHKCIRQVIKAGILAGGTTASDESFVNLFGRPGRFQKQLKVYENKNDCYNCGTKIKKIKIGGRGTYYCPKCQL